MDMIIPRTKKAANIAREINATERIRLLVFAGSRGFMAKEGSIALPEEAAIVF
jgi:hypothetical protein